MRSLAFESNGGTWPGTGPGAAAGAASARALGRAGAGRSGGRGSGRGLGAASGSARARGRSGLGAASGSARVSPRRSAGRGLGGARAPPRWGRGRSCGLVLSLSCGKATRWGQHLGGVVSAGARALRGGRGACHRGGRGLRCLPSLASSLPSLPSSLPRVPAKLWSRSVAFLGQGDKTGPVLGVPPRRDQFLGCGLDGASMLGRLGGARAPPWSRALLPPSPPVIPPRPSSLPSRHPSLPPVRAKLWSRSAAFLRQGDKTGPVLGVLPRQARIGVPSRRGQHWRVASAGAGSRSGMVRVIGARGGPLAAPIACENWG